MERQIDWTDEPGYDASPIGARVVTHKSGVPWIGVVLSDALAGTVVHYNPRIERTSPCYGDDCWCGGTIEIVWAGWLHVMIESPFERSIIVRITAAAGEVIKLHALQVGSLRGLPIMLERKPNHDRGIQYVRFGKERRTGDLPIGLSVTAIVEKMFRGGRKGSVNPVAGVIRDEIAKAMSPKAG